MTHTLHTHALAPVALRHASDDDSPPYGLQSNKAGSTTYKDWGGVGGGGGGRTQTQHPHTHKALRTQYAQTPYVDNRREEIKHYE